jgi:hypothetical protein
MTFKNIKTAEDLAQDAIDAENAQKVSEAKDYLASTDFYMTIDKYATLTDERKAELTQLRAEARKLINELEVADVEG